MNEIQKLDGKLVESIGFDGLAGILSDALECGLDSIVDNEAVKSIPIVGSLIKFGKAGVAFRDWLYVNKLLRFLKQIDSVTQGERDAFFEKNCKDSRKFERAVFQIIEKTDREEKAELIGKIFRDCIIGIISYEDALKLSNMVNRVYWTDLEQLIENGNAKIDEHNQSLVMAGLFIISKSSSLGNRGRYNFGGVKYEITYYGKKLLAIANQKDSEID